MNNNCFRLSSICDIVNKKRIYKMFVPYDDIYTIICDKSTNLFLYDENMILLKSGNKIEINLTTNQIIFLDVCTEEEMLIFVDCVCKKHNIELPYQPLKTNNLIKNEFEPCEIIYTKRDDNNGLYVNCNNPEKISLDEINTVLTAQDVSNKDVFFTFEHNNYDGNPYYYGYRVTNNGNEDIYVTIKNIGYHIDGPGSWLGENEWIQFYNTKFISDTTKYTISQKNNYDAYVGFCNTYEPSNNKPITYRIPSKKYIYVIGGTTKDSYNNINVFDTANKKICGGCTNAAVLFSVAGENAYGSFMLYDDDNANKINSSNYVKKNEIYGYISHKENNDSFGCQYAGYDNCHGVVDAQFNWTFDDNTITDYLPVKFQNKHFAEDTKGIPYSEIKFKEPLIFENNKEWITHLSPNNDSNIIGTDMTNYITIDHFSKKPICIDINHYDGRGKTPNIGNWMVDYIESFTLTNKGNKTRTVTYNINFRGALLAFIRNEQGLICDSYTPKYCISIPTSDYGDEITDTFSYSIEIPSNTTVKFYVNYNLLANSYGCVKHSVSLK